MMAGLKHFDLNYTVAGYYPILCICPLRLFVRCCTGRACKHGNIDRRARYAYRFVQIELLRDSSTVERLFPHLDHVSGDGQTCLIRRLRNMSTREMLRDSPFLTAKLARTRIPASNKYTFVSLFHSLPQITPSNRPHQH
jgi:hypothetical protein